MAHPRLAAARLRSLLRRFPAVALLGARQVGKSTLARTALAGYHYLDLEDPRDAAVVERDVAFVLSQHQRLIIDEAQRFPPLFPALRSHLDRNPKSRVVVLGSAAPGLVSRVSEALTGRVGIVELDGISILEHAQNALWISGGFPRVHWSRPRAKPTEWYPAYVRTTLEQDIPQLGFRIAGVRLRNLLTMLAHAQGNVCNLSELGGALGVSYHSVAHIIDVFEGIFLVRRLQPYFADVGKRLVKSPKVYVRDTGILHSLLGVPFKEAELLRHPKAGASFETFCIEQLIEHAKLADERTEAFFYRTHTGREVDLLLRLRGELVAIEIKLGVTAPDTRGLETCMSDLAITRGYVVNRTVGMVDLGRGVRMGGLLDVLRHLRLAPAQPRASSAPSTAAGTVSVRRTSGPRRTITKP